MPGRFVRALVPGVWILLAASLAGAQNTKKIAVQILDGHTGEKASPDNIEVRINRLNSLHVEYIKMNDDGTADLLLPENATSFSLRATYGNSLEYFVNCDVAKQKNNAALTWFPVADALSEGITMENDCANPKEAKKLDVKAKPGEFILLVRKHTWRDAIPMQ
jgi:hypothetical protein